MRKLHFLAPLFGLLPLPALAQTLGPVPPSITGTLTPNNLVCALNTVVAQDCANNPLVSGQPQINIPGHLSYTGAGNWNITTPASTNLILFKYGGVGGNIMARMGLNGLGVSIETDVTLTAPASKTLSGTIGSVFLGQPIIMHQTLYSGTGITGSPNLYMEFMQGTSSVGGQAQFATLGVQSIATGSMSGNTYTIDCIANTSGFTAPGGNAEIHCARYSTNISENIGGGSGTEKGYGIGSKDAVTISNVAGLFWSLAVGKEIVVNEGTSAHGTKDVFGISIAKNGTGIGTRNDSAIAFANGIGGSTTNNIGQWSNYLIDFGANGQSTSVPLAATGTLVGSGTSYTVNHGIDLGNMTCTLDCFRGPLITPSSSTATCTTGGIVWDAGFIYICTATNTWKRALLATF